MVARDIPFPFDHGGTGDHWFVSMALEQPECLVWMENSTRFWKERSASASTPLVLNGLSMFSGGGALDRGLEEGGAVRFTHAVDDDSEASHTQRANSRDPTQVHYYCGSVNDYQQGALKVTRSASLGDASVAGQFTIASLRRPSRLIAGVGHIDVIAAGCPCQTISLFQDRSYH